MKHYLNKFIKPSSAILVSLFVTAIFLITTTITINSIFTKQEQKTHVTAETIGSLTLAIDHTKVNSTLADFPVLVHLGASSGINSFNASVVFTELGSDANRKKISVTTAAGTELYVEIEKWDTVAKQAWLWVKVPSISSATDTILYLNYDKNRVDNTVYVGDIGSTPAQNVWNNGFIAVYHMNDQGAVAKDSTGKHDGTRTGIFTPRIGRIGPSASFTGSNYVTIPDHNDFSLVNIRHLLISTWFSPDLLVMPTSDSAGSVRLIAKSESTGHEWSFNYYNDGSARDQGKAIYFFNLSGGLGTGVAFYPYGDSRNNIGIGQWQHLAGRGDEDPAYIHDRNGNYATRSHWVSSYQDGVPLGGQNLDTTNTIVLENGPTSVFLGRSPWKGSWLIGQLDEVRFESAPRSDTWIKTNYSSQSDSLISFTTHLSNSPTPPPPTPTPPAPTPSLPTGMTPTAPISQTPSTTPNPGLGSSLKLTIDQTKIDSTLTDFPVLVHLGASSGINSFNASAVFTELGSDANRKKISVITAAGTELYVEIEKWDTANKQAWLWVKVPNVSGASDTILYLNYDQTRADNTAYIGDAGSTPAQNVWNIGYVAVYHMNDQDTVAKDSTGKHNGIRTGTFATVNGPVGPATNFNGASYITIPDADDFSLITSGHLLVSVWLSPNQDTMPTTQGDKGIRFLAKAESGNHEWLLDWHNKGTERSEALSWYHCNLGGGLCTGHYFYPYSDPRGHIPVGKWQHVAGRFDETATVINGISRTHWVSTYWDGLPKYGQSLDDTVPINPQNGNAPVKMGRNDYTSSWWYGKLDEVRIEFAARSDAWIKATHYSESDELITFSSTALVPDTPPTRSGGQPTSTITTSNTTLSLSTNEASTCRYSTTANTAYDSMTSTTTALGTSHSWSLSGLANGAKTYYIKCNDASGNMNTNDYAISFTVSLAGASSLKLTIDQTKVDSSLADFPILVHLGTSSGINSFNASAVFTELGSDANRKKISVITAAGTELYVEIEKWDTANKQAWLWVKVPSVSGTVDTILYLNYDKNRVDNTAYVGDIGSTPGQNVWTNGFVTVNHFAENGIGSAGEFKDSTGKGHNGQNFGAVRTNGKAGSGQSFNGTSSRISIPDSDDLSITNTCKFTVSIWYNPALQNMPNNDSGYVRWLAKGYTSGNWEYHLLTHNQNDESNRIRWYNYSPNGGLGAGDYSKDDTLTPGVWKYITATSSCDSPTSGNEWVYVDGAYSGNPETWQSYGLTYANGSAPLNLGNRGAGEDWFSGNLDELRISNVVRSTAWIKANYSSQSDTLISFATHLSNSPTPPLPTPTLTTTPTTTPITITPTTTPTTTFLSLTIFQHGIGNSGDNTNPNNTNLSNKNPIHATNKIDMELYDTNNQLVRQIYGQIAYNPTDGNYQGTIGIYPDTVSSGMYYLKVKTANHLKKLVPGIFTITAGKNNTLPAATLVTGNSNNDNMLNILDYNLLLGCYSDLKIASSCDSDKKIATDFNDDSFVNYIDYNLFLREITSQPEQ